MNRSMGRKSHHITDRIAFTLKDIPFVLFYQGDHEKNPGYNIFEIVEHNLSLFYSPKLVKKLVYLVIESVQNVERYSARVDNSMDFSLVYSDGNTFRIITQNLVHKDHLDDLKNRLESIENKHKGELTNMYMEALSGNRRTEKGAGLGLIDLARKSRNNLVFRFNSYDDTYSCYQLEINYPITETPEAGLEGVAFVETLTNLFANNDSTFFYRGDFSNEFLMVLLGMLKDIKSDDLLTGKSEFQHTLIEVIQNIKRHGKAHGEEVPGYLCLEWLEEGDIALHSCNLIEEDKSSDLSQRINELNNASEKGLDIINKEIMKDFSIDGGLGLIHAAKFSRPNLLSYSFNEIPSFGVLFGLTINFSYESTSV